MREISFQSQFNGAYCTLTSFGYFDEETNLKLAQAICQSLKPGGRFLLDVLNRDYVVSDLPSRVWWEGNGCVVLEEVEFNYQTSRLQIHRSIVFNEGHQVEQDLSLRIYSLHELGKLLRAAGFRVMEISGSVTTRGHFFGAASRQILLLCERPET
jgi:SAM-dependent methyltransferase